MGSEHWIFQSSVSVHCGARVEEPPTQCILSQVGTTGRVSAKAEVMVGMEEKPDVSLLLVFPRRCICPWRYLQGIRSLSNTGDSQQPMQLRDRNEAVKEAPHEHGAQTSLHPLRIWVQTNSIQIFSGLMGVLKDKLLAACSSSPPLNSEDS